MKVLLKIFITWLLVLSCFPALAYIPQSELGEQNQKPESIEGVGIDEKLNSSLPEKLFFTDENGEKLEIANFYNSKKPLILSMVYFSCPSLCNLHLRGVFEALNGLGLKPGEDFEFLAISIDPGEKTPLAKEKKKGYISTFLRDEENSPGGIHFLVGDQENISKLTESIGFKYKWNGELEEWAHASAAVITTPQGVISRYLHGVYFDPKIFSIITG